MADNGFINGTIQEDTVVDAPHRPHRSLYIHFECQQDLDDFAQLTGLDVNFETRFTWFPQETSTNKELS